MKDRREKALGAVAKKANTLTVFDLLGVMFIGLKLTGHIDWSWWLVTLPLWWVYAMLLGIACVLGCAWATCKVAEAVCEYMVRRERARGVEAGGRR